MTDLIRPEGRRRSILRRSIFVAAVLLLLAFALRVLGIDGQPLNGDEAFSILVWGRVPPADLIGEIALRPTEPHPPLALLSLHGWIALVGDSLPAVRLFAVLPNMLMMAAAFALTKRLAGVQAGLLVMLLLALSPFQVAYGQFARNYALWGALSMVTLLTLWRTWQAPHPERFVRWLPYIGLAALTGYVFYLEAFMFVAHNLIALFQVSKKPRTLPTWVGVQLTLAAALAPWWLRPTLFSNAGAYDPNGEPANPLWALQAFLMGDTLPPPLQSTQMAVPSEALGVGSVVAVVVLVGALVGLWRGFERDRALFITAAGLLPLVGLAALAIITGRGYFAPRYILSSAAPLVMLTVIGLGGLPRAELTRGAGVALLAGLSVVGLWGYHTHPAYRRGPDYAAAFALLEAQTHPNDAIIVNTPDPAFDYYYQGEAPLVVLPKWPGGAVQADAGVLATAEANALDEIAQLADDHRALWFFPLSGNATDPNQVVFNWLLDEQLYISDQWIGPLRVYQFADFDADESAIGAATDAEFEGVARLRGFNLTPPGDGWQPGTTAYVELFWEPLARTDEIVNVTVQLWDGARVVAQDDQMPQGGRASMEVWEIGALVRDAYALQLPPDLPPGEYTVLVGLYSAADPANRYPLVGGGEAFQLVTVTVR